MPWPMQALNTDPVITAQLFSKVIDLIADLCVKVSAPDKKEVILTEADLQSWIFYCLQNDLEQAGSGDLCTGDVGVHCNVAFLDEGKSQLNKRPDIILLDKKEYSSNSSGALYKRKGFTVWGSAIMIEIKLCRGISCSSRKLRSWKEDIKKLSKLGEAHFSNREESFFPLFVALCKERIPRSLEDGLADYASDKGVSAIISRPDSKPLVLTPQEYIIT